MKPLIAIIFLLMLTSCATNQSSATQPTSFKVNAELMSEPTPSDWEIGSIWNFVQYGKYESEVLNLTFKVTDKSTQTCSSGDWRELEIIDGQIGDSSIKLKQSYSVSGRLLTIDLTGACDLGEIQGALSDGSFEGQTSGGPFTFGKYVPQRVVGRRIQ